MRTGGRPRPRVATHSRRAQYVAVTLGATVGMVLADALATFVGRLLGRNLPEHLLRRISGVIFILFGLLTLGSTFVGG